MPKKPKTNFDRLLLAMELAGDGQAFATRADLAAFGAAMLDLLNPAMSRPAEQEYCTLSYLARRYQCSRDFMAVRLAHPSIRKITAPGSKRVKYNIEDAITYFANAENLQPVYNS